VIEGTIRGTKSLFEKFKKTPRQDPEKKRSKRCKVKTYSTFSTSEARWKGKSPTGKVRLRSSHTNLFKIARRAWSFVCK
jgi:hypothetical protein